MKKKVSIKLPELKKGDFVNVFDKGGKETFARVLCVVQINLGKNEELVEFNSTKLKITKRHPIWFNDRWQLPCDIATNYPNIAQFSKSTSNYVYNLLLENSHIALINEIACVTFGHGIKEIYHSFYGTSAVTDVIKTLTGFDNGLVQFNGSLHKLKI